MKKIAFLFFTLLLTVAFAQEGEFEDDFGAYEDFDHEMIGEFEKELDQEVYDPFQGYNRVMTGFNDKFYVYLLNPVTKGYKTVAPKQLRDRFSDFFHNLMFPIRFANNILQGKFEGATIEVGRFLFNTTFGVGGLFDAASAQGLKVYDEDFGQTLGHYGVGPGPHIVMPFLGPTNLRDLPSKL
ncbi:MAG: MlaA family lipoprotein, partial [Campylobacterota bacterium]